MVNPALVLSLVNLAVTTMNSTDKSTTSINLTANSTNKLNNTLYRNSDTGVMGNLLIGQRGNFTHLPDCDDQMDYCDFAVDPPNQTIHVIRDVDLARCDPVIFMHTYEYLGKPMIKVIVNRRT